MVVEHDMDIRLGNSFFSEWRGFNSLEELPQVEIGGRLRNTAPYRLWMIWTVLSQGWGSWTPSAETMRGVCQRFETLLQHNRNLGVSHGPIEYFDPNPVPALQNTLDVVI